MGFTKKKVHGSRRTEKGICIVYSLVQVLDDDIKDPSNGLGCAP
jgi:hypothetical protein